MTLLSPFTAIITALLYMIVDDKEAYGLLIL